MRSRPLAFHWFQGRVTLRGSLMGEEGDHGCLTSSPARMSRTARSKRWGPSNTTEQLGSQL